MHFTRDNDVVWKHHNQAELTCTVKIAKNTKECRDRSMVEKRQCYMRYEKYVFKS